MQLLVPRAVRCRPVSLHLALPARPVRGLVTTTLLRSLPPQLVAPPRPVPRVCLRPAASHLGAVRRYSSSKKAEDLYEVLDIAPDASAEDIKKAYRKLALKYHPDRNPDSQESAKAIFQKVSKAYTVLSDPDQRLMYDKLGIVDGAVDGNRPDKNMTPEEAQEIFKQMFGNKPIDQIIRDMEEVQKQADAKMNKQEESLRIKYQQHLTEAAKFQEQAFEAQSPKHVFELRRKHAQAVAEASKTEQQWTAVKAKNTQQKIMTWSALNQLRRLDPAERRRRGLRMSASFGAFIGAYFGLGYSLLGSAAVGFAMSFTMRMLFALSKAASGAVANKAKEQS